MEEQRNDQTVLVRELSLPIYTSRGWIKFLGIMSILQGIISIFTIIGIFIAWLPIWIGVLLYQTASIMERAFHTGDKHTFNQSLGKLRIYFMIQGILTLLGLIIAVIALSLGVLGALFEALR